MMSNKVLGILLVVLLLVYAFTRIFKDDGSKSFETSIIQIDTASVDLIIFHPRKSEEATFSLKRVDSGWKVVQDELVASPNIGTVSSILKTLSEIEIKRVVAKSKEKWSDYDVEKESGLRIEVFSGSKKVEDFIVGRFNFNQQTRSATSYLRKENEEDTYALDGFLSMSLDQSFEGLRDKRILSMVKDSLYSIVVEKSGISNTINRQGKNWITNTGDMLDSTRIQNYLDGIVRLSGSEFENDVQINQLESLANLRFQINDSPEIVIRTYKKGDGFIINSSQNKEAYFQSDSSGVIKKVFIDFESLFAQK